MHGYRKLGTKTESDIMPLLHDEANIIIRNVLFVVH